MSGKFITLEGGEGVGKSTQLRMLAQALRTLGHRVVTTREPGGSPGAEAIRTLLMNGDIDRWSARTEALLFAAARADHVERTILPALERGEWVLCDRFVDSTRAYQGGAGGLDDEEILALHAIGCKGLLPDRTFVLTLDVEQATARAELRDGGKADRFALKQEDYHRSVSSAFLKMAEESPDRMRVISASGTPEGVTARLLDALGDLL